MHGLRFEFGPYVFQQPSNDAAHEGKHTDEFGVRGTHSGSDENANVYSDVTYAPPDFISELIGYNGSHVIPNELSYQLSDECNTVSDAVPYVFSERAYTISNRNSDAATDTSKFTGESYIRDDVNTPILPQRSRHHCSG